MTYSGATAASSLANPPMAIGGGLGGVSAQSTATGGGRRLWLYNSSHSSTQMMDANFFTDAFYLGMKRGDLVMGAVCTGSSVGCFVGVVGAVSTNGAALTSTGGAISSTLAA